MPQNINSFIDFHQKLQITTNVSRMCAWFMVYGWCCRQAAWLAALLEAGDGQMEARQQAAEAGTIIWTRISFSSQTFSFRENKIKG